MGDNNIEKDDDKEISIDFSKIKNIFKRKGKQEETKENIKKEITEKKEEIKQEPIQKEIQETKQELQEKEEPEQTEETTIEQKTEPKEEEKDDEEISIDFSKIKGIFRRKKQGTKESKEQKQDQDEEISFDIKDSFEKTLEFTKKHYLILLILIPIILSIYFRMYPAYLPVTDEWAENSVYNSMKSDIKNQINQQYPNLPDENKNALVDSEFKNALKQNKAQIDEQIKQTSAYFKSKMQDDSGQTYLLAIDPYLWYGEIKASLKSGFFGNKIIDSKKMYNLRNGRFGRPAESVYVVNLYVGLYLYRIMHFFNGNISLMAAFFLVPMIIVTLSTIPAFFIGRKIGGNIAGLFAGIIVAVNAALLGRTPAGFADTDPYNIFFPLFIAWMFVEAIEATTTKKRIIFSSIGGILVGLYSKAWSGWWYPMMFVLATLVFCLVYYLIKNYKELKKGFSTCIKVPNIKNTLVIFGYFFSLSMVSVILLSGFNRLIDGLSGPFGFIRLKEVAVKTLWPNVLTTVAEFNVVPLKSIISQMGGNLLFIIAIIGILLTIIIKNKQGKRDIMYASFLTIWFIGATYAFTKGTRFSILMVPAFAIAFGIALGITYRYASKWVPKELHINKYISNTIIILLFLLLLIGPIKATHNTAKSEIPSFTDAWHDSLTAIRDDAEDALITSWWDFGHWFAAISERKVTFDGADQGKRIHYVGKSLLVDEEESVAILKMLNCGQNKGPFLLEDYFDGDTPKAIDIINEIMFYDKEKAIERLEKEDLTDEQIENLTKLTHCDDLIPQYYITSQDMIGKAGVWSHFGSWDFNKARMHNRVRGKLYDESVEFLKNEFNMSDEEADKIYYEIQSTKADSWISQWPSYMGGPYSAKVEEEIVTCSNGIQVNLTDYNAIIPTQQGVKHPDSIVYATKQGLLEKKFEDNTIKASLALIPDGESYKCLLTDPLLAKSTFTRLFFFDGHGSKYFKKFSDRTTFTGQRIIVWKVNWEPEEMNIMDELIEKTEVKKGDKVKVEYTGTLNDGTVFDSSEGKEPLEFVAGAGQMIEGFDKGVIGMKLNETKTITIPPEKAYGTNPDAHPLGNKTLHFEVKVISIS